MEALQRSSFIFGWFTATRHPLEVFHNKQNETRQSTVAVKGINGNPLEGFHRGSSI